MSLEVLGRVYLAESGMQPPSGIFGFTTVSKQQPLDKLFCLSRSEREPKPFIWTAKDLTEGKSGKAALLTCSTVSPIILKALERRPLTSLLDVSKKMPTSATALRTYSAVQGPGRTLSLRLYRSGRPLGFMAFDQEPVSPGSQSAENALGGSDAVLESRNFARVLYSILGQSGFGAGET